MYGIINVKTFDKVKSMLYSNPVLTAPNFENPFKLAVDASNFGMGGVLLEDYEHGLEHPVCYFSKKFDNFQKNYSTFKKGAFALLSSLRLVDVYLGSC